MKHLYFIFILVFCVSAQSQIVNIPDENFKSRLVNVICASFSGEGGPWETKVDTNNDGEIQESEAAAIRSLNISSSGISSLEGISAFVNLERLFANGNAISTADLSNLTQLHSVQIAYNQISSISVNPNLVSLEIQGNQLTSLDFLNANSNLIYLEFSENQITEFNLTHQSLESMNASSNFLTSLDTSTLNLKELICSHNQLTQLTLNSEIEVLECTNNMLTSLDLPEEMLALSVNYNQLSELTIPAFKTENMYGSGVYGGIHISGNLYTTVENMPSVADSFSCNGTQLTSLVIPQMMFGGDNIYAIADNPHLQFIDARYSGLCEYSDESFDCHLMISGNPQLAVICLPSYTSSESFQQYFADNNNSNLILTTYCDFTPGGNYNSTIGSFRLDYAGSGCSETSAATAGIRVNVKSSQVNYNLGATMTNTNGGYIVYSTTYNPADNNITLTPQLENPYFSVSPASFTTSFTGFGNTATPDFCITSNGIHPDLQISLIPIGVARPGFDATYKIIYQNKGTEIQSGTISIEFEDAVTDFVSANPAILSQTDNSLLWAFADLTPFETREITLTLNLNSPMETPAVNIGDQLLFSVAIDAGTDETLVDNSFDLEQTVVGSLDPNDKMVSRTVIDLLHLDEYLYYTVRFQNTEIFMAENVVVKDLLSEHLDLTTLQTVTASHPYRATLTMGNKLEFFFEGINLPASIDNEPGSHGFVTFKIKPLTSIPVWTTIENTAEIFFDFNFPIVTNTVTTTLNALGVGEFDRFEMNLYPNPVNNSFSIQTDASIKSVTIYNTLGQLVKSISGEPSIIDVSELARGAYFLQVVSDKGKASKKLLKL